MRTKTWLALAITVVGALALTGFQTSTKIDRKQLRTMLTQLGYEVTDLDTTAGKEKYSLTLQQGGLNIPIAAEISANENYVWLTVLCKDGPPSADKAVNLLKRNADIQPSQFYITKSNKTMLALCIENHEITNAVLRQRVEKIADDVVKTKDDWQ